MNNFEQTRGLYRIIVIDWLNSNEYLASEHIINIIISVLFTRDHILIGGDLAKAVCDNNLFQVVRCADKEVWENLKIIVLAYHNISIPEYLALNPHLKNYQQQ